MEGEIILIFIFVLCLAIAVTAIIWCGIRDKDVNHLHETAVALGYGRWELDKKGMGREFYWNTLNKEVK